MSERSTPGERRGAIRTAVVWSALRPVLDQRPGCTVVDIGGGTGGFAVRVAELGHPVVVVDPSPDALAALGRRAQEAGVADRITGHQGDLSTLPEAAAPADVVLCHGVLELAGDPATALETLAGQLRPGGVLSLLVAQQHAAVVARALAGHFQTARDLLADPAASSSTRGGRRFTVEDLAALLPAAGLEIGEVHGIRIFSDLVPGSLLDLEPGATAALVDLERAASVRPEYLPLATQLHVLARIS